MLRKISCGLSFLMLLAALVGCGPIPNPLASAQRKIGWKAEDYFDDPQVIALCRAIEADDIPEMQRLVAAGGDVNAQGKGKMTPLMWAFPGNKLERFKWLLEHGADPNVIADQHLGKNVVRGSSVTHMASASSFPGYFEAVFEHGGDPNLVHPKNTLGEGFTPLFEVILSAVPNKKERIRYLLNKGADINYFASGRNDPAAMWAVGSGQFDIVLMLLQEGADFMVVPNDIANTRLMHRLIIKKNNLDYVSAWTPSQRAAYDAVIRWLEDHGDSRQEAQQDLERWDTWSRDTGEYARNMAAEVAARNAREAQKKQNEAARANPDK